MRFRACSISMMHMMHLYFRSWHESREFQGLVQTFHDDYARFPPRQAMRTAKADLTSLLQTIRKEGILSSLDFQGSSYEGIKVSSTPLEFDCFLKLSGGDTLTKNMSGCSEGYTHLLINQYSRPGLLSNNVTRGQHVSTTLVKAEFRKRLQSAVDREGLSRRVRLGDPYVAVKMTVLKPGTNQVWYTVDMVPGFEVAGENYVAQSGKGDDTTWYLNNAMKEKEKLRSIDRGNGCRKMCIRIFKVIRDIDPVLYNLGSYPIKNTMLLMARDNLPWGREYLGERFIDLLTRLEGYLRNQRMPKHDLSSVNVLQDYRHTGAMARRINLLLNNKRKMRELLSRRPY